MHATPSFEQIEQFFYGPGRPLQGLDLEPDEAVQMCLRRYPSREIQVVSHWMIIDLELPDSALSKLGSHDCKPVIVFASRVHFDSRGKLREGAWMRSGFQTAPILPGLFQAGPAMIALVGSGIRKCADGALVSFMPTWKPSAVLA